MATKIEIGSIDIGTNTYQPVITKWALSWVLDPVTGTCSLRWRIVDERTQQGADAHVVAWLNHRANLHMDKLMYRAAHSDERIPYQVDALQVKDGNP